MLSEVCGYVALLTGAMSAAGQFYLLKPRRVSRIRQVMMAPSGYLVRLCLLVAAFGWLVLTGAPAAIGITLAILGWELTIRVAERIHRARHRRA
jgi:hypothetical protein